MTCVNSAFLLNNGATYHIANGTALVEYVITLYFAPTWKSHHVLSYIGEWTCKRECSVLNSRYYAGISTVIIGQTLRSTAMVHASTNFSHAVAYRKRPSHRLVTEGIYQYARVLRRARGASTD